MFTKENNPHKNKGKMISLEHDKEDSGGIEVAMHHKETEPSYPTTYLSHKNLPKMKPGQKVKLHGVVKSFSTTERSGSEGNKMDNNADIDIHHMEPMEDNESMEPKMKGKAKKDEEAIEEGLAAAENNGE